MREVLRAASAVELWDRRCGRMGGGNAEAGRLAQELLWSEISERHGSVFVDVVAPPPRLILFGAVDVATALWRFARAIGWRPYVVAPRTQFGSPERFSDAEEVIAAWPEQAVSRLGGIDAATSIAVLTHDPKPDDAALRLALRSGQIHEVGVEPQ